jgi:inositol-pentakisphosphate 2-kinase
MSGPITLEFPLGAQLIYLAEGGANVVYQIIGPSVDISTELEKVHYGYGTPPPTEIEDVEDRRPLDGKLLRLRKHTSSGISYLETARNFDRIIRPLFKPGELIDQTLVKLPKGLIQKCNEQLRADEKLRNRPKKRHGVYLSTTEPFGLLITDMTSTHNPRITLAELKPKWLLQSPSAPINATRCRTCALREMKNSDARKTGAQEERSFCPLDLVSENPEDVLRATRFIRGCTDRTRLARFLYQNRTLLKLREHQRLMKEVGLFGQPAQSKDMSLSMTLRDCTMFIKV